MKNTENQVLMHQCIRQTMRKFDIKVVDVANKIQMNPANLSRYLSGRNDIQGERLARVLLAMPDYARIYALSLLEHQQEEKICHECA